MAYKILLVGGGTGGHVYPLVAVAEELMNKASQTGIDLRLQFMGDGDVLKQTAGELGIKSRKILSPKWRRYFSFSNFLDIFKIPVGLVQSLFFIWLFMPDIIFTKGGYASVLPFIIGKLFMIPIYLHESDAIPGSSNKFLSKFAKRVFVSLDTVKNCFNPAKTEVVGNPIRSGILNLPDKNSAVSAFGLDPNKPVLLITGASQGAKTLNDILLLSLVGLIKKTQIIHQCGSKNFEEVNKQVLKIIEEGKNSYGSDIQNNYRLYPVLDLNQMAAAYAAADIVLARGGSQIFEISAVGKPLVVVPLRNSANNHQLANAREIAKFGATIIEEDNLSPNILINEIWEAYENRAVLSEKIKRFARLDASSIIASRLLGVC